MFGISYGELFIILGATAAVIGPKDLPLIGRTLGRLAGRSIGCVQLARGQFDSVMQQSQARQVHKELQDTMAQLEAIRHEIRTISFMNPGPLTTRLVDKIATQPPDANVSSMNPGPLTTRIVDKIATQTPDANLEKEFSKPPEEISVTFENTEAANVPKDHIPPTSLLSDIHSQATTYARLAESMPLASTSMDEVRRELKDESGQFVVLPVSAETAKLLPSRKGDASWTPFVIFLSLSLIIPYAAFIFFLKLFVDPSVHMESMRGDLTGSDILLEAVIEEEVAHNAKSFLSQSQK